MRSRVARSVRRRGRIQFPFPPSRTCGLPRRRSIVDWSPGARLDEAGPDRIIRVHRGTRVQTERAFCSTYSSTRSIIAARRTRCSAALPYRRRNSTSSSRSQKHRCAPSSLASLAGPRGQFGTSRIRPWISSALLPRIGGQLQNYADADPLWADIRALLDGLRWRCHQDGRVALDRQ
jgi:hypothetical protein